MQMLHIDNFLTIIVQARHSIRMLTSPCFAHCTLQTLSLPEVFDMAGFLNGLHVHVKCQKLMLCASSLATMQHTSVYLLQYICIYKWLKTVGHKKSPERWACMYCSRDFSG